MKKYIVVAILLCCSSVYPQLSNQLNKTVDGIATVRNDDTLLDSLFFTSTYSQATFDIIAHLQKVGQNIDNYTSVASAKTAAKANSGLLIIGRQTSLFQDSTVTVAAADSITIFDFRSGVLKITGDVADLHLLNSLSDSPEFIMENTNSDASDGQLVFVKDSSSPADDDPLGSIHFKGDDSTGTETLYTFMSTQSSDVTNGDEAGQITFWVLQNNATSSYLDLNGYNGTVDQGEIIFNENGRDVDIRMEAVGVTNAIIVQGSDGNVGIGTAAPQSVLDVAGAITADLYNFAADGQADDDYEIALPGISALTTGLMVTFTATTQNTGGATLEITSVGDLDAILKLHDQALATGDIEAGQVVVVVFDGTNWQMTSQLAQ